MAEDQSRRPMRRAPSVAATAAERCMLCGGTVFRDLVIPQRCTMRRCLGCGFWVSRGFQPEQGLSEHYGAAYQESLYGQWGRRKRRSARFIMQSIEGLVPRGRFLDLGASLGYVVAAAQERGWEAYGVDVSADAVAACRRQGLPAEVGDLQHIPFPDGFFDVVHARHVLEHDVEVYRSLEEIRRVLKDDGLLVLEVPDGDCPKVRRRNAWVGFWWPEHLVCFTRPTLAEFKRRAGFVRVRAAPLAGLTRDGLGRMLPFCGWRMAHILKEKLGWGKAIESLWRKGGEPDWPPAAG